MAQYNSPPKKKAKKPDEFVSFFDHLTRYFMLHQGKFWILIACAVAGFSAYAVRSYLISERKQDLAMDYMKAEQAPAAEAVKAWEDLGKKNPPSPLKEVVDLQVGGALVAQQQFEPAAQAFQKSAASKSFMLYTVARLAYAVSLEDAKKYPEALAVYQEVADMQDDPFRYRGQLGLARVYTAMGQPTEAERILLDLLVKKSDAPDPVKNFALGQLVASKVKPNPETH